MVDIIIEPQDAQLEALLARPVIKLKKIKKIVKPILKQVKERGDKALIKFAEEFDHAEIKELRVTDEEVAIAKEKISPSLIGAIDIAKANIERFHRAQITPTMVVETAPGVICRRESRAITSVGLYIPGGTAPLFSTVLMLAIPAKLAGCKNIVLCTPPDRKGNIHPAILYAADLVGVHTIIKAGGAQAIAAMAYGTESVPKVYKIFGPGNQYVTAAKQIVSQNNVAIDMPAGPSEVAVYADETCVPSFVAADLLSQAEHGADSQVILVASSEAIATGCLVELEKQLELLPRKELAAQSISNSRFLVVGDRTRATEILNKYAAEHLILSVENPEEIAANIDNAGSVFLGNYTPEAAGDYASGTNHTLPTNGAALAYSGVSIDSFVKKVTFQNISEAGIFNIGSAVETMAEAELLQAHKNAITVRLNYLKDKI